jgi:hypothetical protein
MCLEDWRKTKPQVVGGHAVPWREIRLAWVLFEVERPDEGILPSQCSIGIVPSKLERSRRSALAARFLRIGGGGGGGGSRRR